ncbi:MAG: lipid-A-disaccharide synthase N-terminal domain-containing protein [Fusobacteriaceae bacterium]
MDFKNVDIFMIIGFLGQGLFSARFIVQWFISERRKKSIIPFSFWILSILGSLLLLTYAIHKKDPVFILGQAPGLIIYTRNIFLIKKHKMEKKIENKSGE